MNEEEAKVFIVQKEYHPYEYTWPEVLGLTRDTATAKRLVAQDIHAERINAERLNYRNLPPAQTVEEILAGLVFEDDDAKDLSIKAPPWMGAEYYTMESYPLL